MRVIGKLISKATKKIKHDLKVFLDRMDCSDKAIVQVKATVTPNRPSGSGGGGGAGGDDGDGGGAGAGVSSGSGGGGCGGGGRDGGGGGSEIKKKCHVEQFMFYLIFHG